MTERAANPQARASAWSGAVLAGLFVLIPFAGWGGPLAFAPLVGLAGLLTLRGLRVADTDRPAAIALVVILAWSLGSMAWSPYTPTDLEGATAFKLIVQAALYWAVVCAARDASPPTRTAALRILAWGLAALGLLLSVETATGALVYRTLREAMGDPIRPDLAIRNVAQAGFVLALLTPAGALAALRTGQSRWLIAPMVAGSLGVALLFATDAPAVALAAAALAGLTVHQWPRIGPRVLAAVTGVFFLSAPALVWLAQKAGAYALVEANVPTSWALRMGYWRRAVAWIGDHPSRGWGLDASRMFSPGIKLHPHDAALQLWLELGLIGAMAAAVFWASILWGLGHKRRDPARAVGAATAAAYLTYSAFSFGVWQEWFLAIGALAAAACVLAARQPAARAG
ncbi:O-antigen ligase [Phenylobacterium sp.]|uniref:O-antigen ligase family protein n=1 Tax=Phenylobacterium sp. TaxID=1871053 RepID=UPI002736A742|nr:O-antigen ligase family protein [Phenylobacterium sp.]MDP3852281.1 O-antigen ligase family protein [Phenylobacterium sp.]